VNEEVLSHITSHHSELKAKAFVAVLALAAETAAQGEGRFNVRLSDFMRLLGFTLGRRTNSAYYWSLKLTVVAMQVTLPRKRQPLVVFERLLAHAAAIAPGAAMLEVSVLAAVREDDFSTLIRTVREADLQGFELELSEDILSALGLIRPMNALEEVPAALLALKGPAFWLAWHVAFLRRWAVPPESGRQGKVLLKVLQESGYLVRFRRGAKVRFKDALSLWWQDVGELVAMGLLDEPGVRLYGWRGSGWQETSTEVSRLLDPMGGRVTEHTLQETRVVYTIPALRVAQLRDARRHSERLRKTQGRS
jgi:hypothetical protein